MAVEVNKGAVIYPEGVQIDVESVGNEAVLVVSDVKGKIVALVRDWNLAHVLPDEAPAMGAGLQVGKAYSVPQSAKVTTNVAFDGQPFRTMVQDEINNAFEHYGNQLQGK